MKTARQRLQNLADALVDDIMEASDDDILAEALEDGVDIAEVRRHFAKALEIAKQKATDQ